MVCVCEIEFSSEYVFDYLETIRTAFRVNDGFELFNSRLMFIKVKDENLVESIFQLLINLSEDEENARQSLESQFLKNYLIQKVYSATALQYLVDISLKNQLRSIFMQKINANRYEIPRIG